jgi:hypothetical protein
MARVREGKITLHHTAELSTVYRFILFATAALFLSYEFPTAMIRAAQPGIAADRFAREIVAF